MNKTNKYDVFISHSRKVLLSNETVDYLKYALYNVSQFGTGHKLKILLSQE